MIGAHVTSLDEVAGTVPADGNADSKSKLRTVPLLLKSQLRLDCGHLFAWIIP
jgi:hypothetical protein